jgi:ribosome maturation factor RimP
MCRVSPDIFLYPLPPDAQVTPPLLQPDALRETLIALGVELVDVRVGGSATRPVVKIRIDVPGGGRPGHGISSSDCLRVSRALEAALEAGGVVGPQWELEVSSPGIERPIRFVEHWQRYVGREIRLKATGIRGVRTARIVAVPDGAHVTLDMGGEIVTLALEAIKDATLVFDWSRQGNREAGEP